MSEQGVSIRRSAILPWTSLISRMLRLARRDTNVVVIFVVINNLLRAISSVILTRLLVPEIFGISGILSSVAFTVAMMSDLGFQAFVVRHPDGDKPRFLDTIWTIALARSAILTILLIALSAPIAHLLAKPELALLISIYSLTFLIDGTASLSLLTGLRDRKILRISCLELAVNILQIAASAILAYMLRSPWAIIGALLIGGTFKSILSYKVFPGSFRRFAFDRTYARDLWTFARFVTGSSIITLLLLQSDKLVLARLMPLDAFGLYMLAGNLAGAPLAFTQAYASRVLYPAYSSLWREGAGDLRAQFYAKRRLPSLLYTFCVGGLIGCAPLLIAILYDPRYAGAAIYLQLLAIMPFFALASSSGNETLTATGRIRATFEASVVKLIWFAVTAPLGWYAMGSLGLVAAVGLMEVPSVLLKWVQMRRAGLLDLSQELSFLAAGIVGIAVGAGMDQLGSTLL